MLRQDELISIIIPHYNSIQKLRRLLSSIYVNRCHEKIEVILVDDQSTDDIDWNELKRNYPEIKIFFNHSNVKGAGVCRNIGLEKSDGKWIVFADADDFFLPNYLKEINSEIDDKYDVVYFIPTSINEDTGSLSNRHIFFEELMLSDSDDRDLFLKLKIVVPWSKVYLKEFLCKNNIYFDSVIVSNDVMFSSRCGVSNPNILISKKKIYCVTKDKGTLTTSLSEDRYFQRLEVFIASCQFIKENISATDYSKLDFNGFQFIMNMFIYKISLKKKIEALRKLRQAKIPLIPLKKLNVSKIITTIRKYLLEKKYRTRKIKQ